MDSVENIMKEIRNRAFKEDLYWNVKFPVIPSIQQLIIRVLGMELSPELDATLRVFLEFVDELRELFRRSSDISAMIFAMETELEFRSEAPEEEKREFHEELARLEFQDRRLEQELAQMRQRCNAMRENPPF